MSVDERRKFPRIPLLSQVEVECQGETFALQTRDLSVGGARLARGEASLTVGAELSVRIQLPGGADAVTAEGEVAWLTEGEVGISFIDPASEASRKIEAAVSGELEALKSFEDMKTPPREA